MSFWSHTGRASRFTEPMTRRGRRAGMVCECCEVVGHTEAQCPQLHCGGCGQSYPSACTCPDESGVDDGAGR